MHSYNYVLIVIRGFNLCNSRTEDIRYLVLSGIEWTSTKSSQITSIIIVDLSKLINRASKLLKENLNLYQADLSFPDETVWVIDLKYYDLFTKTILHPQLLWWIKITVIKKKKIRVESYIYYFCDSVYASLFVVEHVPNNLSRKFFLKKQDEIFQARDLFRLMWRDMRKR